MRCVGFYHGFDIVDCDSDYGDQGEGVWWDGRDGGLDMVLDDLGCGLGRTHRSPRRQRLGRDGRIQDHHRTTIWTDFADRPMTNIEWR